MDARCRLVYRNEYGKHSVSVRSREFQWILGSCSRKTTSAQAIPRDQKYLFCVGSPRLIEKEWSEIKSEGALEIEIGCALEISRGTS